MNGISPFSTLRPVRDQVYFGPFTLSLKEVGDQGIQEVYISHFGVHTSFPLHPDFEIIFVSVNLKNKLFIKRKEADHFMSIENYAGLFYNANNKFRRGLMEDSYWRKNILIFEETGIPSFFNEVSLLYRHNQDYFGSETERNQAIMRSKIQLTVDNTK